ncbi:MAG: multidrug efflux RND transporter permease subunit [Acidaminococcaceae bacterium]
MARFFIDRPVFAIVLAIIITLIGTIAGVTLPIAQYPDIANPRVTVETNYVGANAEVVEQSIAQAIEDNVNGVDNMVDMRSTSDNNGGYKLEVMFDLGTDPDMATVKVQNRVAQANATLPSEVINYGITTEKKSAESIMYFALYSPNKSYDSLFLKNYGSINFIDEIKRVNGVSSVQEFGPILGMRIWLQPDKMAQLGVTTADISNAMKTQNVQAPAGTIGGRPSSDDQEFQYSARVQGRLDTVEEFGNIVVRAKPNGDVLCLKDVARIEFGARSDTTVAKLNGNDAIIYPVYLNSDANALNSVAAIKEVIKDAESRFPPDMKIQVIQDNTDFVRESLKKVAHTFAEALVLVLIIVYIFLQNWRATLIPMLAVPVSLIGTFGAFVILGFTINTLTMFAMILAIGLVVDDAIVVVEAVEHHIQANHLSPKEATYRAMKEVSGPVVAIAFVLASVFIPCAFMAGTTGMLYKQFALTIAVSMGLSAVVALSLTPALCSLLLKPHVEHEDTSKLGKFFAKFNDWFERLTAKYVGNVAKCIRYSKLTMVALLVMIVCLVGIFKILPSGFVPEEDQGYAMGSFALPEAASSNRGIKIMTELSEKFKAIPGMQNVIAVSGFDILSGAPKASAGLLVPAFTDWSERTTPDKSVKAIIGQIFGIGAQTPAATVMAFNAPVLPGASSTGGLSLYLMDMGGGSTVDMDATVKKFLAAANQRPEVGMAYSTFSNDTPSYKFDVDRKKAETLGVPSASVFGALQTFLGGSEINDFNKFGRTWKVTMQAEPQFRSDVDALRFFFVRSNTGAMVPLNTLVTATTITSVPSVTRFNGVRAAKVSGNPADGYSSGQAMTALEEVAKETLPTTFKYEWVDQSREERAAGNSSLVVFGIALIFVFLCLAALYESWSIPLSVLLSVPPAILGCGIVQYVRGFQNDVYMQIGLIMLIGLAAKNAILIVEYAKANLEKGENVVDAAIHAAQLRLRPILMTSFAFILGCVPLAIATGAGAGSRTSMGTAVVSGMTVATAVGIFLIPVLFVVVERIFSAKDKKEE